MPAWYVGSVDHAAITQWAALTAYSVGDIRRQLAAPTVGNERAFRCTTAGVSGAAEPTWTITKAGTTTDGTVVWTEATGNSSWGWTAAAARLRLMANGASSWQAAGDTVYVADNHAATEAAAVTYTFPGTAAAPNTVLCVDNAATPPTTLATTGSEVTTASGQVSFRGFATIVGLIFRSGDGADNGGIDFGTTAPFFIRMVNCSIRLGGSSASAELQIGASNVAIDDSGVEWDNVTISFASVQHAIYVLCPFKWINTPSALFAGSSVPTNLFGETSNFAPYGNAELRGVDLSPLNTSILDADLQTYSRFDLSNCKVHVDNTIISGAFVGFGGPQLRLVNVDSGDTNYKYYKADYQGTITTEATIVRTGGASDGTTPISRKMVSSANTEFRFPLESDAVIDWIDATGSKTITVEIITDNVTLTDAEAWIEVEYLGTSGSTLSTFTNDRAASELATPANQTSSSVAWITTGLTTPLKQKLSVTVTINEKGPCAVKVMLAKVSTTMFFCPKPDVT